MKLTDNMLRVISHAYSNNKPMNFLIKAGVLDISDDEDFLVKAYTTVYCLNTLVSSTTTSSERDFYAYLSNTARFNSRLIKEKSIDPTAVTIKEYITANGLVYSDFLSHMYINLSKYDHEPITAARKIILKSSMIRTNIALFKVLDLRDQQIQEYSIVDIAKELDDLKEKSNILINSQASIKLTIDSIKDNINSISNTMSNMHDNTKSQIRSIELSNIDNLTTITSIAEDEILKEVSDMKTKLAKESIIKFIEELKNKIDSAIKNDAESIIYNDLSNSLDTILSQVSIREDKTENHLEIVTKLDTLSHTLNDIMIAYSGTLTLIDNSCDNLNKSIDNFDSYLK